MNVEQEMRKLSPQRVIRPGARTPWEGR
jgi:hypothetical protein